MISVTSTPLAGFLLRHLKREICQQIPSDAGSLLEHIIVFLTKSLKENSKSTTAGHRFIPVLIRDPDGIPLPMIGKYWISYSSTYKVPREISYFGTRQGFGAGHQSSLTFDGRCGSTRQARSARKLPSRVRFPR